MKKLVFVAFLVFGLPVYAQNTGTGAYAFASFDTPGFDAINTGNLNVRFSIPIVNRPGRGLPFQYTLQYEGLIWSPVTTPTGTAWVNDPSWGFIGMLNGSAFAGYISESQSTQLCGSPTVFVAKYTNYVYHDPFGADHALNYSLTYSANCPGYPNGLSTTGDGSTSDGSGYTYNGNNIITRNGRTISPGTSATGQSASSVTDSNGNTISKSTGGSFTDTLGVNALTISGSGPVSFTYPVVLQTNSATTASANLYYTTYTVRTNFGCNGVVEYGSNTASLVDHITLADGSTYSFTYEGTPGASDGAVTARIASVTLPTGGVIRYAYSGGCSGSGMNIDGSTSGLTRTTTDGTRTYTWGNANNIASTTVQDEKGNQTFRTFAIVSGLWYENHRQIYQGTTSGTKLLDRYTCYNNATAPCDGQAGTPPLTEADVTTSYNGGTQDLFKHSFDTLGNLTTAAKYSGGTLLESTAYSYNAYSEPTSVSTTDGSGNTVASTSYGYDETSPTSTSGIPQHTSVGGTRGNQTSTHVSTGSGTLNTTTAYYDTGMPLSTIAQDGGQTSYQYDSTQAFVTRTTLPTPSSGVSLSTSATFSATAGVALSATGMNSGDTVTVNQYDPLLRPTNVSLSNGSTITNSYNAGPYNPYQWLFTYRTLDSSRTAIDATQFDGYGRPNRLAVANGQSANPWYQVDTCYDATGLVNFTPTAYQSTGFNVARRCINSGTSTLYDALGRPTNISTDDGASTLVYNGRAIQTTDVNGVQRITQYDLLGRISGVCEISSNASMPGSGSPISCGMDISGTGFVTSYSYDLANHKVTVTQGAQQRVFQTDAAGRTVLTIEPERGQTTYGYSYNSTGLLVARTRPRENQTNPTVTTVTSTQFDLMGRPVSLAYNNGASSKLFLYDATVNFSESQSNMKGRLSAAIGNSSYGNTATIYSYDVAGRTTSMAQCLPSGCGSGSLDKRMSYTYDMGNAMTSMTDAIGITSTYSLSAAEEVNGITSSYSDANDPATLLSNVQMGPFGPASWTLGNGLTGQVGHDSMGRPANSYVCGGSTQTACSGGTVVYGYSANWKGAHLTSAYDSIMGNTTTSYDEFGRLTSYTLGSNSFTEQYDRYGNRVSQTVTAGSGNPFLGSFNTATNKNINNNYDAAGNVTADGNHTYQYDADGNVIQVDNGVASYIFDALNHRVRQDLSNGTSQEFLYDILGRRSSPWVPGTNNAYGWQYYWGSKPLAFNYSYAIHFQHENWLGTERTHTSSTGTIDSTDYSNAFGDGYNNTGSTYDQYGYATLDYDSTSTTHHAQFRQYSPAQGSWLSPDPYDGSYDLGNPQSFNRYTYALNNPLSLIDHSGLDHCEGGSSTAGYDPTTGSFGGVTDLNSLSGCQAAGGQWVIDPPPQDPNGDECVATSSNCIVTVSTTEPGLYDLYGLGSSNYIDGSANGVDSGGAGFAPDNGPHYSMPTICAASALVNKGLPVGLDALGIIPGDGNLLAAVQVGAGLASAGLAMFGESTPTDAAFAGGGLGITLVDKAGPHFVASLFGKSLKVVPILGNALSAVATYNDIFGKEGLRNYYNDCLAGKN